MPPRAIAETALASGLDERGIEIETILISSEQKTQHGAPFDRWLYAQAKHGKRKLLTVDDNIPKSGAAVIRAI